MGTKKILWGGGISAVVIAAGVYGVGNLSNGEALQMLQAMMPSTRFLCAAVITATSTILALILTLISFSSQANESISAEHYDRIRLIAKLACGAFIASVVLLLTVNLPLEKASDEIKVWLWGIYYGILIYSSLLGGLLVSIILILYHAATDIILVVHPDTDAKILASDNATEEKKDEEREKAK